MSSAHRGQAWCLLRDYTWGDQFQPGRHCLQILPPVLSQEPQHLGGADKGVAVEGLPQLHHRQRGLQGTQFPKNKSWVGRIAGELAMPLKQWLLTPEPVFASQHLGDGGQRVRDQEFRITLGCQTPSLNRKKIFSGPWRLCSMQYAH